MNALRTSCKATYAPASTDPSNRRRADRCRHHQAEEHQCQHQQPHSGVLRIDPVRRPRGVVPRPPDREEEDERLHSATPGSGGRGDTATAASREHVHEVEEELDARDLGCSVGFVGARTVIDGCRDRTRGARGRAGVGARAAWRDAGRSARRRTDEHELQGHDTNGLLRRPHRRQGHGPARDRPRKRGAQHARGRRDRRRRTVRRRPAGQHDALVLEFLEAR